MLADIDFGWLAGQALEIAKWLALGFLSAKYGGKMAMATKKKLTKGGSEVTDA